MKEMTRRQLAIVNFIREFRARESKPPTIAEIAHGFGMTESSAFTHVDALRKKGVLTRSSRARSLRLQKIASFVGDDGAPFALPWWEMREDRVRGDEDEVEPERMLAVRIPASCASVSPEGAGMRAGDVAFLAPIPNALDPWERSGKNPTPSDSSGGTNRCCRVGRTETAASLGTCPCPFLHDSACPRDEVAARAARYAKKTAQNNRSQYAGYGAKHVATAAGDGGAGTQEAIPTCGTKHESHPVVATSKANHVATPLTGGILGESAACDAETHALPPFRDIVLWRNERNGRLRALPSDERPASRQSARGGDPWFPLGRIIAFQRVLRA